MPRFHEERVHAKRMVSPRPDWIDGQEFCPHIDKRESGWHAAAVLRQIAIDTQIVKWGKDEDREARMELVGWEDHENLLTDEDKEDGFDWNFWMVAGFEWEEFCAKRVESQSGTIFKPGKHYADLPGVAGPERVWMTPDGYSSQVIWKGPGKYHGQPVPVVEEFKCTYRKRGKVPIEDSWLYLHQCKAYCSSHALDTQFARIHVKYVNGVYEKVRVGEPEYWIYWVEFSPQEVEGVWNMIGKYISGERRRVEGIK